MRPLAPPFLVPGSLCVPFAIATPSLWLNFGLRRLLERGRGTTPQYVDVLAGDGA